MTDTLKNVTIEPGVWVNAHTLISTVTAAPVPVGTAIGFQVLGQKGVLINVGPSIPTKDSGYQYVDGFGQGECEAGDSGFWIHSPGGKVTLNMWVV